MIRKKRVLPRPGADVFCHSRAGGNSEDSDSVAADSLDSRLRALADEMAVQGTGHVLESVSLAGRIAYVGAQMEAFERLTDDAEDRFDDD